ncbi:aldose epimerase family protein [Amedibacillus sp. YH-ame10]
MEHNIKRNLFSNENIDVIVLKNQELEVHVTSLGCTIVSIFTKDKNGQMDDVVLGFDNMDTYLKQDKYIGAIVGRCAGRIRNGEFNLNDQTYTLPRNNGKNTLHGGIEGFNAKIFDYIILEDGIRFHYISKDGEEGFPGNLDVYVTYVLEGSKVIATYEATCDQDTILNITNHSYFNLAGKGSILDHELMIHAKEIICCDEDCCANGKHRPVHHSPFDFNESKPIGRDIDIDDEQLNYGGGYDHYFIFEEFDPAVVLKDPNSGRVLEVSTNQPGCQIYTSNFLDGTLEGKKHWYFNKREAVCIETQAAPNAIHIEKDPSTILRKNEKYVATTTFAFTIEGE